MQLLFELQLEDENFSKYSDSDFIKLNKRIKVERQINSEITIEVSEKFVHVIKFHPNNLEVLLSKKTLTNVFLEKETIFNKASITNDNLSIQSDFKDFFYSYLEDDLNHIIKRIIAKKEYRYLNNVMVYSPLFSYDFINDLQELLKVKLTYANQYYNHHIFSKQPEYDFLVSDYFFKFINCINNKDIESLLLRLYNKIVSQFNISKESSYSSFSLVAFFEYKPKSESFSKIIRENHKVAIAAVVRPKNYRKDQVLTTIGVFAFIAILSMVIHSLETNNELEGTKEKEEFVIRNLKTNEKNLYYYIQNNKLDRPNKYKVIENIKTGDNPFDIKLTKDTQKNSVYFNLLNDTEHDLIIFDYKLNFEATELKFNIKDITFVKSRDSIKIFNSDNFRSTFYSFYIGDSLSSFKNKAENIKMQLYRKDRTPESRFLLPINESMQTFKVFFSLNSRTVITKKKRLKVFSKGMRYEENGFTRIPKENFFLFEEVNKLVK